MQVAGSTCHLCHERVLISKEGRGCPACGLAWHVACKDSPELCPVCGVDNRVAAKAADLEREKEIWPLLDRGRTIYRIMLVLRIVAAIAAVIALMTEDTAIYDPRKQFDPDDVKRLFFFAIIIEIASLLFFIVIWVFAYFGKTGARYWLGLTALLGLVLGACQTLAPDGFSGIKTKRSAKAREAEYRQFVIRHPVVTTVWVLNAVFIAGTCVLSGGLARYEAALRASRTRRGD